MYLARKRIRLNQCGNETLMYPEKFPIIEPSEILTNGEYHGKGKHSTVGWLKELFLYRYYDKESFQILPEDKKDYKEMVEKFKEVNGIPKNKDLDIWEESADIKMQAKCLNVLRKKLKYTEVTNR